jgi:hypothetical protein
MYPTLSRALLAVVSVAACTWSAAASAQQLPALSVPGLVTNTGKSFAEGGYPGVGGGIPTGQQDHVPVQIGSGDTNEVGLVPPGTGMWPAIHQIPGTTAAPMSNSATMSVPAVGQVVQQAPPGLYTAPDERDPLSRFAP